ncbi:MAG: inositol monophosphatase [Candidatus Marinimicrobia bacterium]|nr:inositol monophosphatase [Candidatus Neomarinimicrobiota bacterium]|tara:strand:- start:1759 stop:2538 length:780 start_codon:yes stop_codon:yes gene_type:complete
MKDYNYFLDIALNAAKEASLVISSEIEKELKVDYKGVTDLVTNVDLKAEEIIMEKIISNFPDHRIITEESGEKVSDSEHVWIIDPIDGTTNLVHGYPFYAVSIALYLGEKALVAVVYHIYLNDIYSAINGGGAFCNGKSIFVSKTNNLSNSLLATGFPYDHGNIWAHNINLFKIFTDLTQGVRRAGSASLDLCHVARGWLDGYWEYALNSWDIAAGALIVKEAGGKVTNCNGSKFSVFENEILSSNGYIHNKMIEHLNH